ncbi:MAG: hypothetical protein V3V84_01125 [Candidatus Bathyarchaeia archaeon]|jgi:hypothetical protein
MSNDDHEKSNIDAKELSLTRCNACGGMFDLEIYGSCPYCK